MTVGLTHPLVCVVGPTASGKTALAQDIAQEIGAGVLSADSMQVYAGMDIGTGKIAVQERTVPYYGLDLVDPLQPYSAALFQAYGRSVIDHAQKEGSRVVVCGGTGFYVRALVDNFEFPAGEQVGNEVRDRYAALCNQQGPQAVWDALNEIDPDSAALIPPLDTKRVIRALELYDQGESFAVQRQRFSRIEPFYEPLLMLGIEVDPRELACLIDTRVDEMKERGLIDEVSNLLHEGYRDAITSSQAIGYKEIVAYLDGVCSLDDALDDIKRATRQYAKRQRTWFRKDARIRWIDGTLDGPARLEYALSMLNDLESTRHG